MLPEYRFQGESDQWAETKMGPPQHLLLLCSEDDLSPLFLRSLNFIYSM